MTAQPYRSSRRLGDILRARFRSDPFYTLEGARAELTREVVTGDAVVEEELPRGFRVTRGHRDTYYIEAGKDYRRDADEFWFTNCGGGRSLARVEAPPVPPADPHPAEPESVAQRGKKTAPVVEKPFSIKEQDKAKADARRVEKDKRRTDATKWLVTRLRRKLREKPGRKPKPNDFRRECMKKFELESDYEFDDIVWPDAREAVGLKSSKVVAKKRPRK